VSAEHPTHEELVELRYRAAANGPRPEPRDPPLTDDEVADYLHAVYARLAGDPVPNPLRGRRRD
jgi:hypothetical protein